MAQTLIRNAWVVSMDPAIGDIERKIDDPSRRRPLGEELWYWFDSAES